MSTNGHALGPLGGLEDLLRALSAPIPLTDAKPAPRPRKPRKKHVPIAPAGTVPSGEVEWACTSIDPAFNALTLRIEFLSAQTWFAARAAAMALFACEASQVQVVRA